MMSASGMIGQGGVSGQVVANGEGSGLGGGTYGHFPAAPLGL